jgi:maltose alpha-D-glucosyltransferase/alpha-amylase
VDVEAHCATGTAVYAMPLAIAWDDKPLSPFEEPLALARVRKRARLGYLTDALTNPAFLNLLLQYLRENARIPMAGSDLVFAAESEAEIPELPQSGVDWLARDVANSLVAIGGKAILKLIRVPEPGIHPEPEMVQFLAKGGFAAVPRLLGTVSRRGESGETLLLIAEQFIPNQGDAFTWTTDQIKRLAGDWSANGHNGPAGFGAFENFVQRLGTRLGEMHAVLGRDSEAAEFAPEKVTGSDVGDWTSAAERCLKQAFEIVGESKSGHGAGANFSETADTVAETLRRVLRKCEGLPKFRIHGDFHLGQVLVAAGDVVFIDFEGDVRKPLQQRRRKASPLRDVAGILRSFDGAIQLAGNDEGELEKTVAEQRASDFLAELHRRATEAFLQGYGIGRGTPLARLEQDLIVAFALEEAASALCHANRQGKPLGLPAGAFVAAIDRLRRAEP